MANLQGFDATQVPETVGFYPLPPGQYVAIIVASELKPTRSGTGKYLELTFQLVEGPHAGRRLWQRLNLHNPNQLTVQIARAELAAICRAVDVLRPNDSTELHNRRLVITVRQKVGVDGEIHNEIAGYAKWDSGAGAQSAPTVPQSSVPPWSRG